MEPQEPNRGVGIDVSHARTQILGLLRHALSDPQLRYPPPAAPPLPMAGRTPVTQLSPHSEGNAGRFKVELEELHGTCDVAANPVEARMLAVQKVLAWSEEDRHLPGRDTDSAWLLAWPELDAMMPGLSDALTTRGFELRHPADMSQREDRSEMAEIRIGITSAYAAFATTGSLLLRSGPEYSRVASLLPFYHLAVIPENVLWLNFEAWLAYEQAHGTLAQTMRGCANLSLVSGPSKSADIESRLTLGVHGPRHLHAIIAP